MSNAGVCDFNEPVPHKNYINLNLYVVPFNLVSLYVAYFIKYLKIK